MENELNNRFELIGRRVVIVELILIFISIILTVIILLPSTSAQTIPYFPNLIAFVIIYTNSHLVGLILALSPGLVPLVLGVTSQIKKEKREKLVGFSVLGWGILLVIGGLLCLLMAFGILWPPLGW